MNNTERFVKKFYESIQITNPEQLSILNIAEKINMNIKYWGYSSAFAEFNGQCMTLINENVNPQQQWQEFGHEMSHYFKDQGNKLFLKNRFIVYRELKADYFTYHFCVPTFMLMKLGNVTTLDIIKLFNVEYGFALKRLEMQEAKMINNRLFDYTNLACKGFSFYAK